MSAALPFLVVVTGLPCSGKSTLAARLRAGSGWPLLAKDAFKETLFDALGWHDRSWSRRLSGATYALQFQVAAELLASGQSVILEGNFRALEHEARFRRLLTEHPARVVTVSCKADPDVLLSRFRDRVRAGIRHPGHVDAESAGEIEAELARPLPPLVLPNASELEYTPDTHLETFVAGLLDAMRDQRPSPSSTSA